LKGQTPYLCKYVELLGFFLSTLKIVKNQQYKEQGGHNFFFLIARERGEKAVSVISDSILPFRQNFK